MIVWCFQKKASGGRGPARERIDTGFAHASLGKWTCSICGKMFSSDQTVKRHIRHTHLGQRDHECQYCGMAYKRRYRKVKHESRCQQNPQNGAVPSVSPVVDAHLLLDEPGNGRNDSKTAKANSSTVTASLHTIQYLT